MSSSQDNGIIANGFNLLSGTYYQVIIWQQQYLANDYEPHNSTPFISPDIYMFTDLTQAKNFLLKSLEDNRKVTLPKPVLQTVKNAAVQTTVIVDINL